jgi:hypothetical protein
MSDFETKRHFTESNLENPGTPTSLATGATVLMSLGFAVFAIGIAVCFTSSHSDAVPTSRHLQRAVSQAQTQKSVRDLSYEIQQYSIAELAMRPSPQTIVFSRGTDFAVYHWRKDCPLLHGLQTQTNFKTMLYMTRLQAENCGYRYCHYCCELERNDLTKLQQYN